MTVRVLGVVLWRLLIWTAVGLLLSVVAAWVGAGLAVGGAPLISVMTVPNDKGSRSGLWVSREPRRFGIDSVGVSFFVPSGPLFETKSVLRYDIDHELARVDAMQQGQEPVGPLPAWMPTSISDDEGKHVFVAQGWPFRSLWCRVGLDAGTVTGGIGLGKAADNFFPMLAYRPIWPGLIANTAIFGATGCLIVAGLTTTRCTLRRRAGRCPDCGYDLAGTSGQPCPECGRGGPKPSGP